MSLFNTLDDISLQEELDKSATLRSTSIKEDKTPQEDTSTEPIYREQQADNKEAAPQKKRKSIDRLKFLKPCTRCGGRNFTHCRYTGFFCSDCHPEVIGDLAYALGNPDQPTGKPQKKRSGQICPTKTEAERTFAAGSPWVFKNKAALLAAGWTRSELFRRSRIRYPAGNWGLAWLSVWLRPGVQARLTKKGAVKFHFVANDRKITQSASPTALVCKKNRAG